MKDMRKNNNSKDLSALIERYEMMKSINRESAKDKILSRVKKRKRQKWLIQLGSIAALLILSISMTYYFSRHNSTELEAHVQSTDGNRFESDGISYSFTDSIVVASYIEELAEENSAKAEQSVSWKTIRCGLTKRLQVVLPDSSIVHLGSGSMIRYNNDYAVKERRVELTGLGYFIVKSSVSNPFVVAYGENEVVATGTQFNVNSYDLKNWKVALIKGAVDVMHKEDKLRLVPGRMACLNKDSRIIESEFDVASEIAWTQNLFVFKAQEMRDVVDQLRKWYGVEFEFTNVLAKTIKIEGSFSRDISLTKALEYLEYCADVRFVEQDDKIYIR